MSNLKCLVCSSKNLSKANAVLAPWIGSLTKIKEMTFVHFMTCNACEFKFFDKRFTGFEMNAIYQEYRDESYVQERRKWEPWYSKRDANFYLNSMEVLNVRKDFMRSAFSKAGVKLSDISSVLDFGGDLGQFIPEEILGSRFLLDVSEYSLNQDKSLTRIRNLSDIEKN
jgi:hypothetical protein